MYRALDPNSVVAPFCHARGRENRDGDNLKRNMGRPYRAAVLIFDGCPEGTFRATASSTFAARFSTRFLCQVKVRGVRVSLEEVEILACRATGLPAGAFSAVYHPGRMATSKISRDGPKHDMVAAAIATNDPDRGRLLGFFVLEGAPDTTDGFAEMKHQMTTEMTAAQLPAVLLPVAGEFPLTPTGKVRRRCVGLLLRDAAHHACLRRGLSDTVAPFSLDTNMPSHFTTSLFILKSDASSNRYMRRAGRQKSSPGQISMERRGRQAKL